MLLEVFFWIESVKFWKDSIFIEPKLISINEDRFFDVTWTNIVMMHRVVIARVSITIEALYTEVRDLIVQNGRFSYGMCFSSSKSTYLFFLISFLLSFKSINTAAGYFLFICQLQLHFHTYSSQSEIFMFKKDWKREPIFFIPSLSFYSLLRLCITVIVYVNSYRNKIH